MKRADPPVLPVLAPLLALTDSFYSSRFFIFPVVSMLYITSALIPLIFEDLSVITTEKVSVGTSSKKSRCPTPLI